MTVPEGTLVTDLYTGETLAELWNHGDRWLAAAGGRGGRGNARFLSNRRRAPTFAEQGEHGEERWLKLEIQLMADVALVGFPNVGKSTLISVISAAKPKIADYPFTTLEPNLGVVRLDDDHEFVVADIPGLIEGASEGRGLGHQFLRHVERARVLCLLVDLAALDGVAPAEQERVLLDELARYRPELLARPRLVVGTKADLVPTADAAAWREHPGAPVGGARRLVISAVTGDGVKAVVGAMASAGARGSGGRTPAARASCCCVRCPPGRWSSASATSSTACRAARSSGWWPSTTSAPTRRPPTSATGSTASASTGCSPAPARSTATWCGSASSASSTRDVTCVRVVVKIGTSSLTDDDGVIDDAAVAKLSDEVAAARAAGHEAIVVSSGAVAAGVAALGLASRPSDVGTLQAISAAGQPRLMRSWDAALARHGLVPAQALLVPHDFIDRRQYLHARRTLARMLELGVVPIINENDAIAVGRDPLRRQRPPGVAGGAQHGRRRCCCCSPTSTACTRPTRGVIPTPRWCHGSRRTIRCSPSPPTSAGADGGAAAWRASSRRRASPRGRACRP